MERPSHISFQASHLSRRLPFFALAAFFQVGAAALIMTGFGHHTPIIITDFKFVPEPDKTIPKPPPPPEPTEVKPIESHITPIIFDTAPPSDGGGIHIATGPGPIEVLPPPKPPALPDHAAVAIRSTHTQPPYPPIAIRQSLQGKVLLRLTVAESGRVAKAEVVTSSGSDILDQAAQAWIVAHWAYKPALDHGQDVASQALASVAFNLKDAR